ncbi:MAG: metX [Pseudonocardiales bacterium]|nr:metX [Pseudonocardiales bacterium]
MSDSAVAGLPVTGAWRPGDPVGARRFADIGALALEWGGALPSATLAYETWGSYDGSNAVLVEHALTGDAHVVGPAGPGQPTGGWWDGLIGPGRALDTNRWFVVAPNVLGGCGGSTGPSSIASDGSPWGSRFPRLTIRDQVRAEIALAKVLGIERWALMVGGSMGGMRSLEWAFMQPTAVERLLLLATCAAASAEQIALCSTQVSAIKADPAWLGGDYYGSSVGPVAGMGIARKIAHISYRGSLELESRFGRAAQDGEDPSSGGRFAIESYLDHHATKLARRFDAGSYVLLSEAMNSHDIGRGRGGVGTALGAITASTVVVSVDTDRLYRPEQQSALASGIPGATLTTVQSPYGHDGFLIEVAAVAAATEALLTA